MKLSHIMGELHSIFNPGSAEDWDNVGLLLGNENMEITKVLFCLDLTLRAVDELGIATFWFWPNVDAGSDGTSSGIRQYREKNNPKNIHFFKNNQTFSVNC